MNQRFKLTRAFVYQWHVTMASLILNETTLFYLNLSTTAPNTSNPFNKIKKWTSNVAKTSHSTGTSKSVYVPSVKSSSLTASVPSKRTTSTSSAIVAVKTQPEKKKIKLDNHDSESTTSRFLEDETVEREAALISPIKGKQRLNSNVCYISPWMIEC